MTVAASTDLVKPDPDLILRWVQTLYSGCGGLIHVCTPSGWSGATFTNDDAGHRDLLVWVRRMHERGVQGIYARSTTLSRPLAYGERGGDEDSAFWTGFFADMDIEAPGHKTKNTLPPDLDACKAILEEALLPEPTLWIMSGGGFYPWWLLQEPQQVTDVTQLREYSRQWQGVIRDAAQRLSYHYGPVGDLSRVLRLPGTVNRKVADNPRPCVKVQGEGTGQRYEFEALLADLRIAVAHAEDRNPKPEPREIAPAKPRESGSGLLPGEDFNQRGTWEEVFAGTGWTHDRSVGVEDFWVRPGKERRDGHSATTNYQGSNFMWVFTTEAQGFEPDRSYTKFKAYSILHHGGDDKAAARELGKKGYGDQRPMAAALQPFRPALPAIEVRPMDLTIEQYREQMRPMTKQARVLASIDVAERVFRALHVEHTMDMADVSRWVQVLHDDGLMAKGQITLLEKGIKQEARDIEVRRRREAAADDMLPTPNAPADVAQALVEKDIWGSTDGIPHLRFYQQEWYSWIDNRWTITDPGQIRNAIYEATHKAHYESVDHNYNPIVKPWHPTKEKVVKVMDALSHHCVFSTEDPSKDISLSNGVYSVAFGTFKPHHPRRFNTHILPYEYRPEAECPSWLKFLEDILPSDDAGKGLLQEFFGYCLGGRTNQQKALAMVGVRRSGKGTILRILHKLMGAHRTTSPRLGDLSGPFGEQVLIDKSLAIFSDVRWDSDSRHAATSSLLPILGEDARSINRKNQRAWEGTLDTRFILASNEVPSAKDVSGAFLARLIFLHLRQSFVGREDPNLTEKLEAELPGILNWALEGLTRLEGRGRFEQPESGRAVERAVREAGGGTVAQYVNDAFEVDPTADSIPFSSWYEGYQRWCYQNQDNPVHRRAIRSTLELDLGPQGVSIERRGGVAYVVGLRPQPPSEEPTAPRWLIGAGLVNSRT